MEMNRNLANFGKVFLLLFWGTIVSCTSGDGVEEIRKIRLAELLNRAGWDGAETVDGVQSLGNWLEAGTRTNGLPGNVRWSVISRGNNKEIRADTETNGGFSTRFLFFPENRSVLPLTGDSASLFKYLGETPAPDDRVQTLPRFADPDRLSDGRSVYRFEGCFMNRTRKTLFSPRVRAALLIEEIDGQRLAFRGKPRHATDRSGIPAKLDPGQTFCTTLTSGKHPGFTEKTPPKAAFGVVEMLWKDAHGIVRFAPLLVSPLDLEIYHGKTLSGLAVIAGGSYPLAEKKSEKQPFSGPELVHPIHRIGKKFRMKSGDGKSFLVSTRDVIGYYPDAPVSVRKDRLKVIREMISAASSKTRDASEIEPMNTDPGATLARRQRHPSERFSLPDRMESADPESIEIVPLTKTSSADEISLTFFATVSQNGTTALKFFETFRLRDTERGPRPLFP